TFQCFKLLNRFFSACFHMFGTCLIFFILLHCKFMHIIFSSFFSDTSLTQTFICKILCFMILSREFIFQAILPFYKFSHLFFFLFTFTQILIECSHWLFLFLLIHLLFHLRRFGIFYIFKNFLYLHPLLFSNCLIHPI